MFAFPSGSQEDWYYGLGLGGWFPDSNKLAKNMEQRIAGFQALEGEPVQYKTPALNSQYLRLYKGVLPPRLLS